MALLFLTSGGAAAQTGTRSATDGTTPPGMTPGAPAGSYALSGFENVNLYNGHLNFSLPLLRVGGRGSAGHAITLPIERHWRVAHAQVPTNCGQGGCTGTPEDKYYPTDTDWAGLSPGYGPGVMQSRYAGNNYRTITTTNTINGEPFVLCRFYPETLTRLTFIGGDGTEYELRDRKYGGKPMAQGGCNGSISRGRVFVTSDGSNVTYVSDAEVTEIADGPGYFDLNGYLLMPEGTRYRVEQGMVRWIRDRNGNQVSFVYDSSGRVSTMNDSLGRSVTVTYASSTQAYDEILFGGFGGAQRGVKVYRSTLGSALYGDNTLKTYQQLFPELNGASSVTQYNGTVVSSVTLPDGRQYQFKYNGYAQLAQVELPTGGLIRYDYEPGSGAYIASTNSDGTSEWGVDQRIAQRRVYSDASTLAGWTRYSHGGTSLNVDHDSYVTVEQLDAAGAVRASERHHFYSYPTRPLERPTSYAGWKYGREYKTEIFAPGSSAPLRTVENVWQQRAAVTWWSAYASANGIPQDQEPVNDPRTVETVNTLGDTGQVSKTTSINPADGSVGFDRYNNRTDVWESDYGAGAPGPYLRHTHTDYLTTSEVGGVTYDYACDPETTCSNNSVTPDIIHLRGLPRARQVYSINPETGVETIAARSETRYDEASPGLVTYDGITIPGWSAPATPARGNATSARSFIDAAASAAPDQACPPEVCVETRARYDQVGNVRYSWDARGKMSEVAYGDSYCNGTLCGPAGYTPNAFAFPTLTKTPKPDPTGAFGSAAELTTSTVYDYYTGLVYSATDANGQTTTLTYKDTQGNPDPLDRLKGLVRPDGAHTDFEYGDDAGNLYVQTLADLDAGRRVESKQFFDGLGRVTRKATYENSVPATPWLMADTEYDVLGRIKRTSMSYRAAEGAAPFSTDRWAESTYDALGRAVEIRTKPDNAAVTTAYSGDRVLVTDQAGKQRVSKSDALGRLTEVWEVTPNDPVKYPGVSAIQGAVTTGLLASAYGYQTVYDYDALGNLRKVTQGTQSPRVFVYDSLGRLTSAQNPESGFVSYTYDENGNPKTKTDARGTTSTYGYDALNRNTTVTYALGGQTAATPNVTRYYDNPAAEAHGLGRLWKTEAAQTARTTVGQYDEAGRPKAQAQQFWVNTPAGPAWGEAYATTLSYNKAGGVTKQIYPSGHEVEYQYDAAGRLGDGVQAPAFQGTLGDGAERTYASQVLYDELGGVSQERYATDTPVYNKRFYNVRGQLSEIRVSTYSITNTDQNLKTNWNRGALINHYSDQSWAGSGTDNNGNLKKQDVYIPADDAITGHSLTTQFYDYDALNRLRQAREGRDGQNQWWQQYDYDRWGNRTINSAATWGAPAPQFSVNPDTNTLGVPSGQSGQMNYDAAGNLTTDTYQGGQGGGGTRAYDAENRMTSAQFLSGQTQTAAFTYDADGHRVKRMAGTAAEAWQVYGAGGELLAEYAPNAAPTQPSKEYGYRAGELLVTAEATAAPQPTPAQPRLNVAAAANGATATASTSYDPYGLYASNAINGSRNGAGSYWNDQTSAVFPDWLQVTFAGTKTIDEIDLYCLQDNGGTAEPNASMTFTQAGVTSFDVQYWTGAAWMTVPGGSVTGNNKVIRKFTFAPVMTDRIRVVVNASVDMWSRIAEVEAYQAPQNVAAAAAGATASASTSYDPYGLYAANAINGSRTIAGSYWNDMTQGAFPDWLQINFSGSKTVGEIDLFCVQDDGGTNQPAEEQMFTQAGVTAFEVQYWSGSQWVTVPGGGVTGNNKVWRRFTFTPVTTDKIRVVVNASVDVWSRIAEVEAYAPGAAAGAGADVRWLVTDQLGTPRMVVDRTGSLAGVTRHDYFPFGEEVGVGVGGRTSTQGYGQVDRVRQKFTGYESDDETGLDYAKARYYASSQGRFTSTDPFNILTERQKSPDDDKVQEAFREYISLPQRWNRYVYTLNAPTVHSDPTGLDILIIENGPTARGKNPAGHTAVAITGRGVYSFGNGRDEGNDKGNIIRGSLKKYIQRELPDRDTKVFLIKTTAKQDAAAAAALEMSDALAPGLDPSRIAGDNCSVRVNQALDAAGIEPTSIPNLPGSSGRRAVNSEAFGGAIEIPRNSNLLGTDLRDLKQFEPRTPIPRAGTPGGTPVVPMTMPRDRRRHRD